MMLHLLENCLAAACYPYYQDEDRNRDYPVVLLLCLLFFFLAEEDKVNEEADSDEPYVT